MKKILCFTIVILMVISLCSLSAFATDDNKLAQDFYDYCIGVLPEDMQPADGDTVKIYSTNTVDGVTFFSASSWVKAEYADVICEFGDVNIYSYQKYQPYELGLYAISGDQIYTLEEAYDKGLIVDVSVLKRSFEGIYTFYEDYVANSKNKYESDVIQKVFKPGAWEDPSIEITYSERYEHYTETGASNDEATPDFVLIYLKSNMSTPIPIADAFGDYVLYSLGIAHPFEYGYGIYIPKTGEVLDLVKAYEMKIEGIENAFAQTKIGRLIGDMDQDWTITIKDATYIQKVLAGMEGFADIAFDAMIEKGCPCAVSDFNRDGKRDIRDATAIQKYIAGLAY